MSTNMLNFKLSTKPSPLSEYKCFSMNLNGEKLNVFVKNGKRYVQAWRICDIAAYKNTKSRIPFFTFMKNHGAWKVSDNDLAGWCYTHKYFTSNVGFNNHRLVEFYDLSQVNNAYIKSIFPANFIDMLIVGDFANCEQPITYKQQPRPVRRVTRKNEELEDEYEEEFEEEFEEELSSSQPIKKRDRANDEFTKIHDKLHKLETMIESNTEKFTLINFALEAEIETKKKNIDQFIEENQQIIMFNAVERYRDEAIAEVKSDMKTLMNKQLENHQRELDEVIQKMKFN
jgi:hypothetical protein